MSTWPGWLHIVSVLEALCQSTATVVPDLALTCSSLLTWPPTFITSSQQSRGFLYCPITGCFQFPVLVSLWWVGQTLVHKLTFLLMVTSGQAWSSFIHLMLKRVGQYKEEHWETLGGARL